MSRNFQTFSVGLVNGGFEFFRSDMNIRFERSHALSSAFVNGATGFVWAGESAHLRKKTRLGLQVRRGEKHVRPRSLVRIDGALDGEVGLCIDAPGGAESCHAACQVQEGKRNRLLHDEDFTRRTIGRGGE